MSPIKCTHTVYQSGGAKRQAELAARPVGVLLGDPVCCTHGCAMTVLTAGFIAGVTSYIDIGSIGFLPASTAKRAPAGRQAVRMRAVGTWLVNSEARGEAQ
jgi:hypothetical protein